MSEVAQEAKEQNEEATKKYFEELRKGAEEQQAKWADRINEVKMATVEHKPELIIIAGPNGSGKTSITQRFLHHEWAEGTTYINPDQVAKDMFGDWNDNEAILKTANYCAELRDKCLAEKKSFVFETVFSA